MKKILYFAIFVVFIIVLIKYMQYKEDRQYENKGQELINEIELYRGSHNKLPETVKDINEVETMGNGPYYEKVNEMTYKVYFCVGFDKYKIYDSRIKSWNYTND